MGQRLFTERRICGILVPYGGLAETTSIFQRAAHALGHPGGPDRGPSGPAPGRVAAAGAGPGHPGPGRGPAAAGEDRLRPAPAPGPAAPARGGPAPGERGPRPLRGDGRRDGRAGTEARRDHRDIGPGDPGRAAGAGSPDPHRALPRRSCLRGRPRPAGPGDVRRSRRGPEPEDRAVRGPGGGGDHRPAGPGGPPLRPSPPLAGEAGRVGGISPSWPFAAAGCCTC